MVQPKNLGIPVTGREADYYNERYKKWPDALDSTPESLKIIGHLINETNARRIIDFGCGTAKLVKYLLPDKFDLYIGIDFAAEALPLAKRVIEHFNKTLKYKLINKSIYDPELYTELKINPEQDIIVMDAILEHVIVEDVLKFIPEQTPFIFSVPNFISPAHLRGYTKESANAIPMTKINNYIDFPYGNKKHMHIVCGIINRGVTK